MNDNDRITSAAKTYKATLKALTAAYEAEMAASPYTEARLIAYIAKADEAFRTYQADRGIIS